LLGSASTALLALWVGWHRFISANLTRWFNRVGSTNLIGHLTLPDFSAKMGSFHEIHKTLSDLCTLQLKGNESPEDGDYLFLVIDDLDRCTPATVKQVFDVVRLVASIKRVVTLVAIDDRIAFAAVASHYTNFTATGREPAQVARDYMAKVFQVAITLPPVNSKSTGLFIRSELFRAELARPDTKTVGDPPAEPTVTIEPPKVDPESQKKVLLSALPDEVTLFELLSEETGISNPRELWRLKQAWFLLKGMVLKDGDGIAEMDPWLRSLFVREWTLRATAEVRKRFDDELEALQEGGSPSPLDAKITKILGLETANALERRAFVDAVLLPAAPAAVSATAGDAQKSNGPATSMGNASAAA
jgi:hypothetical protein